MKSVNLLRLESWWTIGMRPQQPLEQLHSSHFHCLIDPWYPNASAMYPTYPFWIWLTYVNVSNNSQLTKQTKYVKYISIHLKYAITVKYCTRISRWRCVLVLFKCMSQTHTMFCLPNGFEKKSLRRFVFEVRFDLVPEYKKSHTLNVNAKFKFDWMQQPHNQYKIT